MSFGAKSFAWLCLLPLQTLLPDFDTQIHSRVESCCFISSVGAGGFGMAGVEGCVPVRGIISRILEGCFLCHDLSISMIAQIQVY